MKDIGKDARIPVWHETIKADGEARDELARQRESSLGELFLGVFRRFRRWLRGMPRI